MAAEQLLSTIKKQAQVPETPLASQPKVVQPPSVMPQTNAGLPPIQSPVNQPPSINPAYRTPEVRATPQVTPNLNPWIGTYGGANQNYVPTSDRDKAFGDPSLSATDKANLTQNYLKSKGIDTGAQMPQSDEEALKLMQDEQVREKTMLDKRIEQGLASAKKQLEGSTGAINATVGAVNREGLVSAGNKIAANQALEGFNLQFNQLSEQYAEQQRQLAKAQQQQNWNAVNQISKNMENTQIALQQSSARAREESQGWLNFYKENGLLSSATPEQLSGIAMKHGLDPVLVQSAANAEKYKTASDQAKSELDNRIKGVGALTNIFEKGGELSLDDLTSLAGTFDLPMESAISAYQGFNALRNDKSLSNEEKALKGQEIRTKLDREMRGITNAELEKVDYITNLYKSGASQEEIVRAKRVMGIKDEDDPMYRADVAVKNAEMKIKQYEANNLGKPPAEGTIERLKYDKEKLDLAILKMEASDLTGNVPEDAVKKIFYQPGTSDYGHGEGRRECGEGSNDIIEGTKVGNSYKSKMAVVTKQSNPQIGNQLVIPLAANGKVVTNNASQPGHIETVISVNPINESFQTVSWNRDGHGTQTIQSYNLSDLSKYGNNWGFSDSTLKDQYKQSLAKAAPERDSPVASIASDAANGLISYSQMIQGAGKESAKYKTEFSKQIKEIADQEPDPLIKKMILSRAKGDPDSTVDQSWTKASQGFQQVLDLKDTLDRLTAAGKTGILEGRLSQLNIADPDISLLKGQLAGVIPTVARGTFGEVGVLTDADIANYQKVIGNQTMTPKQIDAATTNLIKTIYRNYSSSIDSSSKNTSNRIDQYKTIKNKLPQNIKQELGIKDYDLEKEISHGDYLLPAIGKGVINSIKHITSPDNV